MSWDKGFDFRNSSGYVSDPANCSFINDAVSYPTTVSNGATCGMVGAAGVDDRDRDNTIDHRLAGFVYDSLGGAYFRVDLPAAGDYTISLAIGDATNPKTGMIVTIKDTTTTLLTRGPHDTVGGDFWDASDTYRASAAAWVANQVSATLTFSTTQFRLYLTSTNSACIAHVFISQVSAGASVTYPQLERFGHRGAFRGMLH